MSSLGSRKIARNARCAATGHSTQAKLVLRQGVHTRTFIPGALGCRSRSSVGAQPAATGRAGGPNKPSAAPGSRCTVGRRPAGRPPPPLTLSQGLDGGVHAAHVITVLVEHGATLLLPAQQQAAAQDQEGSATSRAGGAPHSARRAATCAPLPLPPPHPHSPPQRRPRAPEDQEAGQGGQTDGGHHADDDEGDGPSGQGAVVNAVGVGVAPVVLAVQAEELVPAGVRDRRPGVRG